MPAIRMVLEWYRRWQKASRVHHTCKLSTLKMQPVAHLLIHEVGQTVGQTLEGTGFRLATRRLPEDGRHLHGELQFGMLLAFNPAYQPDPAGNWCDDRPSICMVNG